MHTQAMEEEQSRRLSDSMALEASLRAASEYEQKLAAESAVVEQVKVCRAKLSVQRQRRCLQRGLLVVVEHLMMTMSVQQR